MKPIRYPGAATEQGLPRDVPAREEIWWWDHYVSSGWQDLKYVRSLVDRPPLLCCSLGFVIAESRNLLTICQTLSILRDGEVNNASETQVIIKACIERRWVIT